MLPSSPVKHLVVLMLSGRSFDHMLGFMRSENPAIDGLTGSESNLDASGSPVPVSPTADPAAELNPSPADSFERVGMQLFGTTTAGPQQTPTMSGFVADYGGPGVMRCFAPQSLPVLTALARNYAVCDRWFSSVPGPAVPNSLFAQAGTSWGQLRDDPATPGRPSIYTEFKDAGGAALYAAELPGNTFAGFQADCHANRLSGISFLPDPAVSGVREQERMMREVYMALRNSTAWNSSALLIVWSHHGGYYDHVSPPDASSPGGAISQDPYFAFDRLGVRVPALIVSPWVAAGTVDHTEYDHTSILNTACSIFRVDNRPFGLRTMVANVFDHLFRLGAPRTDMPDLPAAPPPPPDDAVLTALIFRLVAGRHTGPELLNDLDPSRFWEAVSKARTAGRPPADLIALEQTLAAQQPGIVPNPLWAAWMQNARREELRRLARPSPAQGVMS